MVQMAASTARDEFPELLNRVANDKERIVLHRDGEPLAAMIPVEDLALLERLIEEEEDRIDVAEAEHILADPTETSIPWEQAKGELGLD